MQFTQGFATSEVFELTQVQVDFLSYKYTVFLDTQVSDSNFHAKGYAERPSLTQSEGQAEASEFFPWESG